MRSSSTPSPTTVSNSSRSFIAEGCTGPLKVMRLLPFSMRMRSAQPRSRSESAGGVEQRVFLQAAAVQRGGAGGEDGLARGVGRVEAQLDLALERRGCAHKRLIIVRSAATSHAITSGG